MTTGNDRERRVVLINGPPGTGKTTLTNLVWAKLGITTYKMNAPVVAAVKALYNLSHESVRMIEQPDVKTEPREELYGKSYTEVQIELWRAYLVRLHGYDIIGRMAVDNWRKLGGLGMRLVVDGVADPAELAPVFKAHRPRNLLLLRTHRTGMDFGQRLGDPRRYILDDELPSGMESVDMPKSCTLTTFKSLGADVIERWMNGGDART